MTAGRYKPSMRPRAFVAVMAKEPQTGRVKTRLARDIGPVAATLFYRHALKAVVGRLNSDPRFKTVLFVAPTTATRSRSLPSGTLRKAQGGGDLGHRMQQIFNRLPPGPAVIVGTDIPGIRADDIATALQLARRHGAVLGPAPDGGFWLIGLNRCPRVLRPFTNVRWSTDHARTDTTANLEPHCQPVMAAEHDDVDDRAAYLKVRPWSGRRVLPRDGHNRT